MKDVINKILRPKQLFPRSQLIGRTSIVPSLPGIYAWYFAEPPSFEINLDKCWHWQGKSLLYVGISPSEPPKNGKRSSKNNLRKRIRGHMSGNASGSTLRMSLGCLLAEQLGIELRFVGQSKRLTFGENEPVLSEWLNKNAYATWITHDKPWVVEREAIPKLYLPLNLSMNQSHPFHPMLSAVRKNARVNAQKHLTN
jgi:hypothetical protein